MERKDVNPKKTEGERIMCQRDDGLLWSVDLRVFRLEVLRCPLCGDWALFVRSVPRRGFIDNSSS